MIAKEGICPRGANPGMPSFICVNAVTGSYVTLSLQCEAVDLKVYTLSLVTFTSYKFFWIRFESGSLYSVVENMVCIGRQVAHTIRVYKLLSIKISYSQLLKHSSKSTSYKQKNLRVADFKYNGLFGIGQA